MIPRCLISWNTITSSIPEDLLLRDNVTVTQFFFTCFIVIKQAMSFVSVKHSTFIIFSPFILGNVSIENSQTRKLNVCLFEFRLTTQSLSNSIDKDFTLDLKEVFGCFVLLVQSLLNTGTSEILGILGIGKERLFNIFIVFCLTFVYEFFCFVTIVKLHCKVKVTSERLVI